MGLSNKRKKKTRQSRKPRVSNNTDSDPKVENEKDLGKLQDDLVGEEKHKTVSVDNEKDLAPPLKRLIIGEDSDKDIFVLWRYYFEVEYPTDEIRDERFKLFQNALSPTKTQKEVQFHNYPGLADQTREELESEFHHSPSRRQKLFNYIFQSDIDTWIEELDPVVRLGLRPPPDFDSVDEQNSV